MIPTRTFPFALAALLLAAPAFAQAPPAAKSAQDIALAEAAFNDGVKLAQGGNCKDAIPKFELSQKIDPASGTALNLGKCYEELGRTASAYGAYSESAGLARIKVNNDTRQQAEERMAALAGSLSKVELHLPKQGGSPKDLTIAIDGKPLSAEAAGVAVPVDPGERVIEVSAPGKKTWKTTIQIAAKGATTPVDIPALEDAPAPPPTSSAQGESAPMPTFAKVGLVAMGVIGVAGIGVGIGAGVDSMNKNAASKKLCRPDDPTRCSDAGVSLRNDAFTSATVSNVGFILGGGFLAAGGAILLIRHFVVAKPENKSAAGITGVDLGAGSVVVRGQW
jgi:hypothetical protein